MTRRTIATIAAAASALALTGQVAVGGPVSAQPVVPSVDVAYIDPGLANRLVEDSASALLWWDDERATRSEISAYLDRRGIEAHVFERLSGALACTATSSEVQAMAEAPGAISVWGDQPLQPALDGSVPTAFNGRPENLWEHGTRGDGVGIAVLDTGVDGTHPDLEPTQNVRVLISHRDLLGPDGDPCIQNQFTDQLEDSELTSGHGTHLAGVAAGDGTASGGRLRGVAPGADIFSVAVTDTVTPRARHDLVEISLLGVIAGIDYVLLNGLEGDTPVKTILAGWTQDDLFDPWHPLSFAIGTASLFGINVVFPVGNEGPGNGGPDVSDCSAPNTCALNPWAVARGAIGVAATPRLSRSALEPYSSRGDPEPRQARNQTVRYEPTIAAPGSRVASARRPGAAPYAQPPTSILGAGPDDRLVIDAEYVSLTGTSVAAAHVAGAIALMQQAAVHAKGCYLTTSQVEHILTSTATPLAGFGSWEVGAGTVDVTAAVSGAVEAPRVPSSDPWMCP